MIHSLDENVGRLMHSLNELNPVDVTLLIFVFDNGGNNFANTPPKTDNASLRAGRGERRNGQQRSGNKCRLLPNPYGGLQPSVRSSLKFEDEWFLSQSLFEKTNHIGNQPN